MDDTKKRILEAATDIFVAKGFSGASISVIASRAGINKSLIYHHVGNKQELWQEVKRSLTEDTQERKKDYKTWEQFVHDIIKQRIEVYERDPRILRIIQWQALEDKDELVGKAYISISPVLWADTIKDLQDKGEIRKDYSASLIAVYIHSLINGLLFDAFNIFASSASDKYAYIEMITKEIISGFLAPPI